MARWERFAWSPDGRWLAFQKSESRGQHSIAIASVETGEIHAVTEPLFADYAPSFDPDGRYLYFLSNRMLNPVYDDVQLELSFPKAALPCLVTLKKDTPSPFLEAATDEKEDGGGDKDKELKVEIDFDGISEPHPGVSGARGAVFGDRGTEKEGDVALRSRERRADRGVDARASRPEGTLEAYDFKKLKIETLGNGFPASGCRRIESRCCCSPTESCAW